MDRKHTLNISAETVSLRLRWQTRNNHKMKGQRNIVGQWSCSCMQRATASSSTLQVTYGICFQRATPFLVFCKKLLNTSLWVGTKYWLRKCPTIWAFARDKLPKKLVFSSLFREICTHHSQWFWVFIAGSGSGQKWTDTGRTLKNAHQFFFLILSNDWIFGNPDLTYAEHGNPLETGLVLFYIGLKWTRSRGS